MSRGVLSREKEGPFWQTEECAGVATATKNTSSHLSWKWQGTVLPLLLRGVWALRLLWS